MNSAPVLSLPQFDFDVQQLPQQLEGLLSEARHEVEAIIGRQDNAPDWQSLMQPLEAVDDRIEQFWSPVSHMNAVMNNEDLRQAYEQCLPMLSRYQSEMGQNRPLYEAVKSLSERSDFQQLSEARQEAVGHLLRDFRLSGVHLEEAARKRFADIQQRLGELATQFSNRLLDATNAWVCQVTDEEELAGLPDSAKALYRQLAQQRELEGWVITLDIPAYLPVMQYAENRDLREKMHRAFVTRASDLGHGGESYDNSEAMVEILRLRQELAEILGFSNYAELSLASKMADNTDQVLGFLNDLAEHTRPVAQREYEELQAFARAEAGPEPLQAWDIPRYAERLKQQRYDISQEVLRPYFPLETVLNGMFRIVGQLFNIEIQEMSDADLWHEDAQAFRVTRDGETIAVFYTDLFARDKKRGGAWMADFCGRRRIDSGWQLPVAFLTCNFSPPTDGQPALLTHDEVTTLFHEFGHGLHHMLTEVDAAAVAGINGVAWDAVELPSQFLENWCWYEDSVAMISGHWQTGEALPKELLDKLLAAKNFHSGLQMLRQLEFALFDFELHAGTSPADVSAIQDCLDAVRERVSVVPVAPFNRFQHSFAHIFAGGYAAGYYSYKWAEVLSADAFSLFEERGVMDVKTGQAFLSNILSRGGSQPAMALFKAFRGREPSNEALLRHSGIVDSSEVA